MTQQAACRSLRRLYQQGDPVPQDPVKAAEYSRRACALGSRTDCPD
jgi:TPR repeat protein